MKIAFSAKNGPNPTRANRRATRPGRMGFPLNEFMAADMCQSGRSGGGGGIYAQEISWGRMAEIQ